MISRHAVVELVAWGCGRRRRVRVRGRSMEPTLQDGDHVLVDPRASAVVGDVVVCRHPDPGRSLVLIKRVGSIGPGGALDLRSDGAQGTDSRSFGPVDPDQVIGIVTFSFDRRARDRRKRLSR